jgi:uncharacterized protein (TIGR02453 family)
MALSTFDGFTPKTITFLKQLKKNNNRDWFNDHKDDYEAYVREPGLALIRDMEKPLRKVSPFFTAVAKKSGGSMMRIYRDIRFSKNKTPYKTNLGMHFRHETGKDAHAPGFYFHIDPDEIFLGAGIWRPENDRLNQIRTLIDDDPNRWKRIVNKKKFRETFTRGGTSLKRHPRGYDPDHPLIEDLKRKDHMVLVHLNTSDIMDRDLIKKLIAQMKTAMPFVRFLCDSLHLPS